MDKYAIIGNPVEHSLSPFIFEAFQKQTDNSFEYLKIKAPLNKFATVVKQLQKGGGKGVNITLPFKKEAYQLANQCNQEAREAHAASAFQFRNDGTIYAVNYDGFGLVRDLNHNYNLTITQKSILIIGAGGATQGILKPLLNTAPARIVISNRTISKAMELVKTFHLHSEIQGIGFNALEPMQYDIIIHATSLGHQGKAPLLPDGLVGSQTNCYDLSYGKIALPFLKWAKSQGAVHCFDGLGMLVEHNAAVFNLWFGIYPDTSPIIKMLQPRL